MGTRSNRIGEAVLTSTHNLCFEQKYEKYQNLYLKKLVFGCEIFNIFEQACFRNVVCAQPLTVQFKTHFKLIQRYETERVFL